jgi:outer membrane lipase/esterase
LEFSLTQTGRVQMRQYKFGSALLMTMILVGCGGGGSDLPAKTKFSAQVSFGDSLSDVGSYKIGTVNALGGGQFTINGPNANGAVNGKVISNWTEVMAINLGLPAPCAFQIGLDDGKGVASGTNISLPNNPLCTGYGQGGARVTDPIGIGNAAPINASMAIQGSALTVPLVTQINNHLAAHGNAFGSNEVVFVMAGANDVFYQLALVGTAQTTGQAALGAMVTAATELVNDVNTLILQKGATHVTVVNVPDIATTPKAKALSVGSQVFVGQLVSTFNTTLKAELDKLPNQANILYVDANTASHLETTKPGDYGLSNVTVPACGANLLSSSLGCKASNLITDATTNLQVKINDHYLFADDVHPTPYGHNLFAQYVLQAMTAKGWH